MYVKTDLSPSSTIPPTSLINTYAIFFKSLRTPRFYFFKHSYKLPLPHLQALGWISISRREGRLRYPGALGTRRGAGKNRPNADAQPYFSGLGEIWLGEGQEQRAGPISPWAFHDGEINYMLIMETVPLTFALAPRASSCNCFFFFFVCVYVLRCGFQRNSLESETSAVTRRTYLLLSA